MTLNFRNSSGRQIAGAEWLRVWSSLYPEGNYAGYEQLIAKHGTLSSSDLEQVGRWKDAARSDAKWKRNTASVAYLVWMQAASEIPVSPDDDTLLNFLNDWSERVYVDEFGEKSATKRFGLSRATTLLHFLSGGRYPIFDSRVRRALGRLIDAPIRNTANWYTSSYCPLLADIASACGTTDLRTVDKALFSYGGRDMPFENQP